MSRFIKVVEEADPEWARKDTWAAIDYIVMVQENGGGATIVMTAGRYLDVVETPAEVLALIDRADTVIIDATEARP